MGGPSAHGDPPTDAEVHVAALDEAGRDARLMWTHFEPVHAVTYFHPRARAALRGGRAAGLLAGLLRRPGRAARARSSAAPVIASFFSFAPPRWPARCRRCGAWPAPRRRCVPGSPGRVQALAELTYELPESHLVEAADLLEAAAGAAGRRRPGARRGQRRAACAASTRWPGSGRPPPRCASTAATGTWPRWSPPAWTRSRRWPGGPRTDMSPRAQPAGRGWTERAVGRRRAAAGRAGLADPRREPHRRRPGRFRAVEDATDRAAAAPVAGAGRGSHRPAAGAAGTDRPRCRTVIPAKAPIGLPAQRSAAATQPQ